MCFILKLIYTHSHTIYIRYLTEKNVENWILEAWKKINKEKFKKKKKKKKKSLLYIHYSHFGFFVNILKERISLK